MKTYVRCKACGFIMDEAHLKDLCPACALPKTVFEPYTKKISPQRKFLLDQHLHPVAVHFPQVFMVVIILALSLAFVVGEPLRNEFLIAAKLSILALPFTVFLGFVTGLIDGQLRFKKLKTPLLVNKIIAGVILQVLSVIVLVLYLLYGFTSGNMLALIGLNVACAICGIYLGRTGSTMFDAIMPG